MVHVIPISHRRGFTLIELIATTAIIALLAALLLPVGSNVLKSAKATQCASNMRQIYTALSTYAAENNNNYPAISAVISGTKTDWDKGEITPYLPLRADGIKANTIFICPSAEYKGVPNRNISRAYCSTQSRIGLDPANAGGLSFQYQTPRSVNSIANKTTSILMYDGVQSGAFSYCDVVKEWDLVSAAPEITNPAGTTSTYISFRHPNNTAQLLRADGHVDMVKRSDAAVALTKPMWRGQ
ncbi:hypothetical protein BH09VER1_BH09VER1_13750 [soil metagenome]